MSKCKRGINILFSVIRCRTQFFALIICCSFEICVFLNKALAILKHTKSSCTHIFLIYLDMSCHRLFIYFIQTFLMSYCFAITLIKSFNAHDVRRIEKTFHFKHFYHVYILLYISTLPRLET